MNCGSKIVVFDLDETLGYFVEFGMFWDALKHYYKNKDKEKDIPVFNQSLFNKLLDLYPEFTRPNILNILNYLKRKKNDKFCHKLMIYTNNQGPPEWAHHIRSYFEEKIRFSLFDQIKHSNTDLTFVAVKFLKRPGKINTPFVPDVESEVYIKNIFHYCDLMNSVYGIVTLYSGQMVLASAIKSQNPNLKIWCITPPKTYEVHNLTPGFIFENVEYLT